MYHHFRGKRELALAALERNCATQVPLSVEPLTGEGSPMERLTRYLTVERDALRGCKVGRMTQDPGVVADPGLLAPVAAAFAAVRGALTGVLGEAIEAGELPAGLDASQVAAALTSAIQGGYVLSIAAQDPQPLPGTPAAAPSNCSGSPGVHSCLTWSAAHGGRRTERSP